MKTLNSLILLLLLLSIHFPKISSQNSLLKGIWLIEEEYKYDNFVKIEIYGDMSISAERGNTTYLINKTQVGEDSLYIREMACHFKFMDDNNRLELTNFYNTQSTHIYIRQRTRYKKLLNQGKWVTETNKSNRYSEIVFQPNGQAQLYEPKRKRMHIMKYWIDDTSLKFENEYGKIKRFTISFNTSNKEPARLYLSDFENGSNYYYIMNKE